MTFQSKHKLKSLSRPIWRPPGRVSWSCCSGYHTPRNKDGNSTCMHQKQESSKTSLNKKEHHAEIVRLKNELQTQKALLNNLIPEIQKHQMIIQNILNNIDRSEVINFDQVTDREDILALGDNCIEVIEMNTQHKIDLLAADHSDARKEILKKIGQLEQDICLLDEELSDSRNQLDALLYYKEEGIDENSKRVDSLRRNMYNVRTLFSAEINSIANDIESLEIKINDEWLTKMHEILNKRVIKRAGPSFHERWSKHKHSNDLLTNEIRHKVSEIENAEKEIAILASQIRKLTLYANNNSDMSNITFYTKKTTISKKKCLPDDVISLDIQLQKNNKSEIYIEKCNETQSIVSD